jgi:hypothetical protein
MRVNAFSNVNYQVGSISKHTHVYTLKKQDKVLMVMYAVAN